MQTESESIEIVEARIRPSECIDICGCEPKSIEIVETGMWGPEGIEIVKARSRASESI